MKLRPELLDLLREVVNEHEPDLLPAVEQLSENTPLRRGDVGRLIRLLLIEVMRTGFYETDESVRRGLMLEEIADTLGDMKSHQLVDK